MGIRFFQPCAALADVVAPIYTHESGPTMPTASPWLIVPDGEVKLIFPVRGDIACAIGDRVRLHRASRLILSGMRTSPGSLAFPDGVDAIGIMIRPEAAYRLLDAPHHELTNQTFDAEDVLGASWTLLQNELMQLSRTDDRVEAVQRALCAVLATRDRRDLPFEWAVKQLAVHEGRLRIDALTHELGWSRRHLERRFHERLGVGPKQLAGVLRFHAVYKRMRVATGSYAHLIQGYYYDQPHFLKDFKRYTGLTPRGYAGASDYGKIYVPD